MVKSLLQKREQFTKDTITQSMTKLPHYNWVICHSPYSANFDGVEGTDWGHNHLELNDLAFSSSIGSVLYSSLQYDFSFLFFFFPLFS